MGHFKDIFGAIAWPRIMMSQQSDGTARYISVDSTTNALKCIDYPHNEVHGGSSFTCCYSQEVSDTGDRTIIAFRTPDTTKYLHITFTAAATAAADAIMREAPTITDNTGAPLAVRNRRRPGTPNTTTVWDTSQNPDVQGQATYFTELTMGNVAGGTVFGPYPLGAGAGPKTTGGTTRGSQEWILAPDTLYSFEVISLTNDDNIHEAEVDWYEHQDKTS
jgi:hypothetical protein